MADSNDRPIPPWQRGREPVKSPFHATWFPVDGNNNFEFIEPAYVHLPPSTLATSFADPEQ